MRCLDEKETIILWGMGTVGRQIVEGKYGKYNILYAVDSKVKTECVVNGLIVKPKVCLYEKRKNLNGIKIVIGIYDWLGVAKELEEEGFHIFEDYIPYVYLEYTSIDPSFLYILRNENELKKVIKKIAFGKKICAIYGFCLIEGIKEILLESKAFNEKYILLNIPPANDVCHRYREVLFMDSMYKMVDLLLVGKMLFFKKEYGPSYSEIKDKVRKECKVVLFTSAMFKGYFPQHCREGFAHSKTRFCWQDENINILIKEGLNANQIYDRLVSKNFYSEEYIKNYYKKELIRLDRLERDCDVKIMDFVREFGTRNVLYYSSTHPTEIIIAELGKRILEKVGIHTERVRTNITMDYKSHGEYIIPSTAYHLGLELPENYRVSPGDDVGKSLNLKEYVFGYYEANKSVIMQM